MVLTIYSTQPGFPTVDLLVVVAYPAPEISGRAQGIIGFASFSVKLCVRLREVG